MIYLPLQAVAPVISGNGRYIAFSSDVYGVGGLVFDRSNQDPLLTNQSPSRNLYLRDLKTFVIPPPDGGVSIDLLIPNNSKVFEFASKHPYLFLPILITVETTIWGLS